jgi:hypothetical protein
VRRGARVLRPRPRASQGASISVTAPRPPGRRLMGGRRGGGGGPSHQPSGEGSRGGEKRIAHPAGPGEPDSREDGGGGGG